METIQQIARQTITEQKQKHVIFLGSRGSGKRSLIKEFYKIYNFLGSKHTKSQFPGLYFDFMQLGRPFAENPAQQPSGAWPQTALKNSKFELKSYPQVNFWVIQDIEQAWLVKVLLKDNTLENISLIIVLDFEKPLEIIPSLDNWLRSLQQHILTPIEKPLNIQNQAKVDIGIEQQNFIKGADYLNLGGFSQINLGIPITVVCHKADLIQRGEETRLLQQNLDFIQKKLRASCFAYNAAIIFTSIQQQTNIQAFCQYTLQDLYKIKPIFTPQTTVNDAIFIPAGSDDLKLIGAPCVNENQFHLPTKKAQSTLIVQDNEVSFDLQRVLEGYFSGSPDSFSDSHQVQNSIVLTGFSACGGSGSGACSQNK